MNADPAAAPEGRAIQAFLPVSRDEIWLCTEDDDFADEPDGKRYSKRLLHSKAGAWSEHPFHGNDIQVLDLEGREVVAIDNMSERLTFAGDYGSVQDRIKDGATEPYGIRNAKQIDGTWWVCGGKRRVFSQTKMGWKLRSPAWNEREVENKSLHDFVGTDGDLLFVGDNAALHYDGNTWTPVPGPNDTDDLDALCEHEGTYYGCGFSGAVWRGDKSGFTKVCSAPDKDEHLRSITSYNGVLYVLGNTHLYSLQKTKLVALDVPAWNYEESNYPTHTLTTAHGLLWVQTESELRTFDGTTWTTVVKFPVEEPPPPPPPRKGPPQRKTRAADLVGLSPEARALYLKMGRIEPLAQVSPAKTKAALVKRGYAVHAKALAFDTTFAGLFNITNEEDENIQAEQEMCLGIYAMLEGEFNHAWVHEPAIDDSDDETLATTTPDNVRAKTMTPIGAISTIECVLFMDAAGVVHVWGSTQGEWFPGAQTGLAFIEQFAKDSGAKPAATRKKPAPKKKPAPRKKPTAKKKPTARR